MTDQPISGGITGGASFSGSGSAPLPKRAASDVIDLIVIPAALGAIFGFFLLNVDELLRDILLGFVYVGWLVVRDFLFSPGRWMVGLKLVSTDLGSERVSIKQVLLRNVLLLPYVLILGYLIETVYLFWKRDRLMDGMAKTRVVAA